MKEKLPVISLTQEQREHVEKKTEVLGGSMADFIRSLINKDILDTYVNYQERKNAGDKM